MKKVDTWSLILTLRASACACVGEHSVYGLSGVFETEIDGRASAAEMLPVLSRFKYFDK